ncbi:helix-turn-helix domain-containing protein, partial [Escherichia coli]|uniref:helix-turn-helix domain-containing protein n=1 Tax=Escherichia coli TaxID=562 RepID=UPI00313BBC92
LMHDATEAYCQDIPAPLKRLLPDYKRMEEKIDAVIREKYGLPPVMSTPVKYADLIMLAYSLTLDEACQFLKISRPTATNWIRTGRLQATRKDPTKPKSPYLTTRQACIAALQSPLHTVQVSAGDGITEERKCHSSA